MNQGKSILVVDDDPDVVETTKIVLESAGYNVMSASNTREATELLDRTTPDLILLDVMMAEVDEGFRFSHKLRRDEKLSGIPIIMLSAIGAASGLKFSAGEPNDFIQADEFLDKPVNLQVLLKKIAAVLEKHSAGAAT